jgi:ABC-type Na+ efflux pump permease subunit
MKRLTSFVTAFVLLFGFLTIAAHLFAASKEKEKVYSFNGTDGAGPNATLIFDAAGNLYGTTSNGGAYEYGAVF